MASHGGLQRRTPHYISLLVINPNSSKHLTMGLEKMISGVEFPDTVRVDTYTAPSGPLSINNEDDAKRSTKIVEQDLPASVEVMLHDGFLVACYSVHPLTATLRDTLPRRKAVIGIFEASISTALSLLPSPSNGRNNKFGIVTTGKYWEQTLTKGVLDYLGCETLAACKRFKGVESTGLSATELHTSEPEEVKARMTQATKRLLRDRDVSVICLGCAGMAGLEAIVFEACKEELGHNKALTINIVDGVKAGLAMLEGLIRNYF